MKVLFMPCGIGIGHASRSIAISKELEKYDVEIGFASYGSGYEILNEYYGYNASKLPDIKFYGYEGELDIKYTVKKSIDMPYIFLKSIYHESRIIKKFQPDLIIADSQYSVPITAKILGVPCMLMTNELTTNFSQVYPEEKKMMYIESGLDKFVKDVCNQCSVIMIPDVEGSIPVPKKLENKVVHVGPFFCEDPGILKDKKELRREFGFDPSEKIVLVTVGGSEFGSRLLKLICDASSSMKCDKIILVTGPKIDEDFVQESTKIVKKKFLSNMMEWMKISDVIVSLAGLNTLMEILSLGIPNVIVPIDNHPEQLRNSQNMESHGITVVEDIKKLNSKKLADNINRLLDDPQIVKRSKIVKNKFSSYNGLEKTVEIIMNHLSSKQSLKNEC